MYGNGNRNNNRNSNFQQSFAPVKEGEELDVVIEAVGEKGDGICKKNGFVLFVPNTHEGDNVTIRITKVLKKVGFAEVVAKHEPSQAPARQEKQPKVEDDIPKGDDSENFGEEPEHSSEQSSEAEESEAQPSETPEEPSEESEEKKDDIDEPPAP